MNKTKKGFSLGEVMAAAFILTTGIIGAVFLSAKSIHQIGDSRNAIIAASLAQEGVELVRNIRDNSVTQETCGASDDDRCAAFEAYAAGTPGSPGKSYGWPAYTSTDVQCSVDYMIGDGLNCTNNPDEILYLDGIDGFYTHDSATGSNPNPNTRFKRKIFIKYEMTDNSSPVPLVPTPEELVKIMAKITSVVTWSEDANLPLTDTDEVESNCKIGKQCAYAQTTLTSWINYGE